MELMITQVDGRASIYLTTVAILAGTNEILALGQHLRFAMPNRLHKFEDNPHYELQYRSKYPKSSNISQFLHRLRNSDEAYADTSRRHFDYSDPAT